MRFKTSPIFKAFVFLLCFLMFFQQSGFTQVSAELDISGHIAQLRNSFMQDKFRPLHLRYLSYDANKNNFQLFLDKDDLSTVNKPSIKDISKKLFKYFLVGVTIPDSAFWVNLRPDSQDNIIDTDLAKTDVGKILLEADLQLKKDTARFTSPQTPEGKQYWAKLYKKAEEIFSAEGGSAYGGGLIIPTLTRPWIVPGEIVIREREGNAYIYKATLRILLEQDYLKGSAAYNFSDDRLKALNEYSSGLIKELIIPKLTQEVNNAKRYAPLRQVYYSLILAKWFKSRFYGRGGPYAQLIDRKDLRGLVSEEKWSVETYFKDYQKSFKNGEYNFQEPVNTTFGRSIRSYFSGGIELVNPLPAAGQTITTPSDDVQIAIQGSGEIPESISASLCQAKITGDPEQVEVVDLEVSAGTKTQQADGPKTDSTAARSSLTTNATLKQRAEEILGRPISDAELAAIQRAHEIGQGHFLGEQNPDETFQKNPDPNLAFTPAEIAQKARILAEAGFTQEERRKILEHGLAGERGREAVLLTEEENGDLEFRRQKEKTLQRNQQQEQYSGLAATIQRAAYSINSNLQELLRKVFPLAGHPNCLVASSIGKIILEQALGRNLRSIKIYGGWFKFQDSQLPSNDAETKSYQLPHFWLIITDAEGRMYYISFTDGQFIDPPTGIKRPVSMLAYDEEGGVTFKEVDRDFKKRGYTNWYYGTAKDYAVCVKLSDTVLSEEELKVALALRTGMVLEEEEQLNYKRDIEPFVEIINTYFPEITLNPIGASAAVATIATPSPSDNADRITKAEEILGRPISDAELAAIQRAHEIGQGHFLGAQNPDGTFQKNPDPNLAFTPAEIAQKARILAEAGFTQEERRKILEHGLAGERDLLQEAEALPISDNSYARNLIGKAKGELDVRVDKENLGGGIPKFIKERGSAQRLYLFSKDIRKENLPVGYSTVSGLRDPLPQRLRRSLPKSFDDIAQAEVILPPVDIFLTSDMINGSAGVVRLGFLKDGQPVAMKAYYTIDRITKEQAEEKLLQDYRGGQIADELGIGPKMYGVFVEGGRRWIVMDIVPGDHKETAGEFIRLGTIKEFIEIKRRLNETGIHVAGDFQFFVTPSGDICIIDQGNLASENPFIVNPRKAYIQEMFFLILRASRVVQIESLRHIFSTDKQLFSELLEYLDEKLGDRLEHETREIIESFRDAVMDFKKESARQEFKTDNAGPYQEEAPEGLASKQIINMLAPNWVPVPLRLVWTAVEKLVLKFLTWIGISYQFLRTHYIIPMNTWRSVGYIDAGQSAAINKMLRELGRDEDAQIKSIEKIKETHDSSKIEVLSIALKDSDSSYVRMAAAEALGELDYVTDDVVLLLELAVRNDSHGMVQDAAKTAAEKIRLRNKKENDDQASSPAPLKQAGKTTYAFNLHRTLKNNLRQLEGLIKNADIIVLEEPDQLRDLYQDVSDGIITPKQAMAFMLERGVTFLFSETIESTFNLIYKSRKIIYGGSPTILSVFDGINTEDRRLATALVLGDLVGTLRSYRKIQEIRSIDMWQRDRDLNSGISSIESDNPNANILIIRGAAHMPCYELAKRQAARTVEQSFLGAEVFEIGLYDQIMQKLAMQRLGISPEEEISDIELSRALISILLFNSMDETHKTDVNFTLLNQVVSRIKDMNEIAKIFSTIKENAPRNVPETFYIIHRWMSDNQKWSLDEYSKLFGRSPYGIGFDFASSPIGTTSHPAIDNIASSEKASSPLDNHYAQLLINKASEQISENIIGGGMQRFMQETHPKKPRYLFTRDIERDDLPTDYPTVMSGLRDPIPQALMRKLPESLDEIARVDVTFPATDILLTSYVLNGSAGVVRLGFLKDGRPVAAKTYYLMDGVRKGRAEELLLNDYQGGQIAEELGFGPKMHGIFKEAGKIWVVMDVVPGDHSRAQRSAITLDTVKELIEVQRRLNEIGRHITGDFQYLITPYGDIVAIDQGSLVFEGDIFIVDHYRTYVENIFDLLFNANELVQRQVLQYIFSSDKKLFSVLSKVIGEQTDANKPADTQRKLQELKRVASDETRQLATQEAEASPLTTGSSINSLDAKGIRSSDEDGSVASSPSEQSNQGLEVLRERKIAEIIKSIATYGLLSPARAGELGIVLLRGHDAKVQYNNKGVLVMIEEIVSEKAFRPENYYLTTNVMPQAYHEYLRAFIYHSLLQGNVSRNPIEILGERDFTTIAQEIAANSRNGKDGRLLVEERLRSGMFILMRSDESMQHIKERRAKYIDGPNIFGLEECQSQWIEAIFVPHRLFELIRDNAPDALREKIIEVKEEIQLNEAITYPTPEAGRLNLRIPDWYKAVYDFILSKGKEESKRTFMLHGVRLPTLEDISRSQSDTVVTLRGENEFDSSSSPEEGGQGDEASSPAVSSSSEVASVSILPDQSAKKNPVIISPPDSISENEISTAKKIALENARGLFDTPALSREDVLFLLNNLEEYSFRFLHGTDSSALAGMGRARGRLIPSGEMRSLGLVPFVGELGEGLNGVNKRYASFIDSRRMGVALDYANYSGTFDFKWTPVMSIKFILVAGVYFTLAFSDLLLSALKPKGIPAAVRDFGLTIQKISTLLTREIVRLKFWISADTQERRFISEAFSIVCAINNDDNKYEIMPVSSGFGADEFGFRGRDSSGVLPEIIYVPKQKVNEVEAYYRRIIKGDTKDMPKIMPIESLAALSRFVSKISYPKLRFVFLELLRNDANFRKMFADKAQGADRDKNIEESSSPATLERSVEVEEQSSLKQKAEEILGRSISAAELVAIQAAHEIGQGHFLGPQNPDGTFQKNPDPNLAFTPAEIAQKARILAEAGFTQEERRKILEHGLAGNREDESHVELIENKLRKAGIEHEPGLVGDNTSSFLADIQYFIRRNPQGKDVADSCVKLIDKLQTVPGIKENELLSIIHFVAGLPDGKDVADSYVKLIDKFMKAGMEGRFIMRIVWDFCFFKPFTKERIDAFLTANAANSFVALINKLLEASVDESFISENILPIAIHRYHDIEEVVDSCSEFVDKLIEVKADIRTSFPCILDIAQPGQSIKEVKDSLLWILQRCKGTESQTLSAISALSGLLHAYPGSINKFIKPIVASQTVGAFLCFQAVYRLRGIAVLYSAVNMRWQTKAIKSEADLIFLRELIERSGVRAYDILNNFIVEGVINEIITSPISSERDSINEFLNNSPYAILELYQAYKSNPQGLPELIERCRRIHKAILDADTTEVSQDPFFGAMLLYVFPPETTVQRDQYLSLHNNRPDHPEHTQNIPMELQQTEPFAVSAGNYVLKDPAKPLDESPWSIILEAVQEVNKEEKVAMSEAEKLQLARDILDYWQRGDLYANRKELLKRIYRYFRATRNTRLPDSLISIREIMVFKEFIADTLRDLISELAAKYRESNPQDYNAVISKMFKTTINNPKALAKAIIGARRSSGSNLEERKQRTKRILRIENDSTFGMIWDKIKDKESEQEIATILENITFQIQPGKEALVITQQLQGSDYKAMQSEVSSKYEFVEGQDKINLRIVLSKRKAHGVAGLNMGVCVAVDEKLWDNPNFFNAILFDEQGVAWGGMHILIIEENGKKYLVLPGINPNSRLLTKVAVDDIYNKLIDYAYRLAAHLGCEAVLIPVESGIHSNRSEMQRAVVSKNYKEHPLERIHEFSYSPSYSFQDCFIVPKPEASSPVVEKSSGEEAGSPATLEENVKETAQPSLKQRVEVVLGRTTSNAELAAIQAAHEIGQGHFLGPQNPDGTFQKHPDPNLAFTPAEIAQKARILAEAGFTQEERRKILEHGLAGERREEGWIKDKNQVSSPLATAKAVVMREEEAVSRAESAMKYFPTGNKTLRLKYNFLYGTAEGSSETMGAEAWSLDGRAVFCRVGYLFFIDRSLYEKGLTDIQQAELNKILGPNIIIIENMDNYPLASQAWSFHISAAILNMLRQGFSRMEGIDSGAGSGILSLVALKLGAAFINLVDIDEQALAEARSQLALNGYQENTHFAIFRGDLEDKDFIRKASEEILRKKQSNQRAFFILSNIGVWPSSYRVTNADSMDFINYFPHAALFVAAGYNPQFPSENRKNVTGDQDNIGSKFNFRVRSASINSSGMAGSVCSWTAVRSVPLQFIIGSSSTELTGDSLGAREKGEEISSPATPEENTEQSTIRERSTRALGRAPTDEEFAVIWQAHLAQAEGETGNIGVPDSDGIYRNSTLSLPTKFKKIRILKESHLFSNDQIRALGDYGAMGKADGYGQTSSPAGSRNSNTTPGISEKEKSYYSTVIDWVEYILRNYKIRFGGNKLIFIGGASKRAWEAARILSVNYGIEQRNIIYLDLPRGVLRKTSSETIIKYLEQEGTFNSGQQIAVFDNWTDTGDTLRRIANILMQRDPDIKVITYLMNDNEDMADNYAYDVPPGSREQVNSAAIFIGGSNWMQTDARREILIAYKEDGAIVRPIYLSLVDLRSFLAEISPDVNIYKVEPQTLTQNSQRVLPLVQSWLGLRGFSRHRIHSDEEVRRVYQELVSFCRANLSGTADSQDTVFNRLLRERMKHRAQDIGTDKRAGGGKAKTSLVPADETPQEIDTPDNLQQTSVKAKQPSQQIEKDEHNANSPAGETEKEFVAQRLEIIEAILREQKKILASMPAATELQIILPNTIRVTDSDKLLERNEKWSISPNMRIAVSLGDEWGQPDEDPIKRGLVEDPAQLLVRVINTLRGDFKVRSMWSNAYGPYLHGVFWRDDDGSEYFTPLDIDDYYILPSLPVNAMGKIDISVSSSAQEIVKHRSIGPSLRSGSTPKKEDLGGIDFRALPVSVQPVVSPQPMVNRSQQTVFNAQSSAFSSQAMNADKEWQEIENMVNAGITPSTERIKEYLINRCKNKELSGVSSKVLCCIAKLLRMEEERCCSSESTVMELLVLLEAGKDNNEAYSALAKIVIMPQEPVTIEE